MAKQSTTMSCPVLNTGLDKPGVNQLDLIMDVVLSSF